MRKNNYSNKLAYSLFLKLLQSFYFNTKFCLYMRLNKIINALYK